jgi:hypothetical protein
MRKKSFTLILVLMLVSTFIHFNIKFVSAEEDLTITITLTVEGIIQTDDPWTTGAISINEWAKPMYYIWLDPNGNPDDARYGNGAGANAHHILCDTGVLRVEDNTDPANPIIYTTTVGDKQWSDITYNIQGSITNNDKSLEVSFPMSLLNNPATLEVSAMCSPYTSSAVDNSGEGSGSSNGWIIISDATVEGSYEFFDVADEMLSWPSSLSDSDRLPNFNIEKLEVVISNENTDSKTDDTEPGDETTTDDEESDSGAISGFEMWLLLFVIIIICVIIIVFLMINKRKKK